MRAFLDSSVLIAAFNQDHVHHQSSAARLCQAAAGEGWIAVHSLAEIYSVLTRMPGRVHGTQALLYLEDLRAQLHVVGLDPREYMATLRGAAAQGIAGGAVYDALVAQCALKAKAEVIFTWNLNHFARLGPEVASRLQLP